MPPLSVNAPQSYFHLGPCFSFALKDLCTSVFGMTFKSVMYGWEVANALHPRSVKVHQTIRNIRLGEFTTFSSYKKTVDIHKCLLVSNQTGSIYKCPYYETRLRTFRNVPRSDLRFETGCHSRKSLRVSQRSRGLGKLHSTTYQNVRTKNGLFMPRRISQVFTSKDKKTCPKEKPDSIRLKVQFVYRSLLNATCFAVKVFNVCLPE